jgi:hypothetical protein
MVDDRENLSKNEWLILESLANDWECLSTIEEPDVSRTEKIELIERLYEKGLISILNNVPFDKKNLLKEPDGFISNDYWFGLTEKGCEEWEKYSQKYYGSAINWDKSWKSCFSPEKGGYIEGVSEQICVQILKDDFKHKSFSVDWKSAEHKNLEEFQAKYYKYLAGGHRIDFKTKRSICKTIWFLLLKIFGKKN